MVVARGGDGSCDARTEAPGGSHATVCCSRSVAVSSSNKNPGFLNTTTGKLLAWEAALNQRSVDAVGALVDEGVAFNGKRLGKQKYAALAGTYFGGNPEFRVVFVSCDLSIQQTDDTWTAECKTVKTLKGTPTQVTDRLVWGGTSGKIESIAEVEFAGKRTGAKDLPVKSGASATGDDLDKKCRASCPGDPVELTHCYCVCMGGCTE